MYDEVIYKEERYQTKDLVCFMEEYRITEDGRLVTDEYEMVDCPRSEQTKFGDVWLPLGKRNILKKNVDTKYHGWLNFYGEENGKWVDYAAKFTDGKLVEIKREERND